LPLIDFIESKNNIATISVEDFGQGMSPRLIEALNKKETSFSDVGIGLTLCLEIASICSFELNFSNKSDHGSLVSVSF